MKSETKNCRSCKKDFVIEPDDFGFYERNIKDVTDEILKAILKCEACGKNYQIIPKELVFLRRFNFPIPRHCPLCRDRARIKQMNPRQMYNRTCGKCNVAIKTSYSPDRPEIVYCENCYKQEVY